MAKWTIAKIKKANEETGHVFFDKSHLKFSATLPTVYEGVNGIAFITIDEDGEGVWNYCVWKFNPTTGAIRPVGDRHQELRDAQKKATDYVAGKVE